MHNEIGNWQENTDGTYSEAIPLPFYGLIGMKQCSCGRHFFREESYREHYRKEHTDGKRYRRTPTSFTEVEKVIEI